MSKLFLVGGVPGSGKTYFCQHYMEPNSVHISRDSIRFSLLNKGEEYFAHEDEVYEIFWAKINEALAADKNVYADQTNLTYRSRAWLIRNVRGYSELNFIWVRTSYDLAIERNEMRKGTPQYVPIPTITSMFNRFSFPTKKEGFDHVYVFENNKLREVH